MRTAAQRLALVYIFSAGLARAEEVTPMQQVNSMLAKLKTRVEEEGKVEATNYQKFERWCDLEAQQCQSDIHVAEGNIEDIKADIGEAKADEQKMQFKIEKSAAEISWKEKDLKKEQTRREEDHAEFMEEFGQLQAAIDELSKALDILSRDYSKSELMQLSQAISFVIQRQAVSSAAPADRMQAFFQSVAAASADTARPRGLLQQPAAPVYAGQSNRVKEVVREMRSDIQGQQKKVRDEELQDQHTFEMLEQSMKAELASLQKRMEDEKSTMAACQERQAQLQVELSDAQTYHEEKATYLEDVTLQCQEKETEWSERSKSRAEELNAIDEAIAILNSDPDKLEAHGPALAQEQSAAGLAGIGFLQVDALTQRAVQAMSADPFGKVKKMIVELVERLLNEQAQEQEHKVWCDKETAKTEKQQKYHSRQEEKFKTRIEEMTSQVQQLQESIQEAQKDVVAMRAAMTDATAIREKEHETATRALADYNDAQTMLQKALQVLSDFYRKRRAAQSLLQRQAATTAVEVATAVAPLQTFSGTDPGAKRKDAAEGILGILEISLSDFTRLISETETAEAAAQKQYDQFAAENKQSVALAETDIKHFTQDQDRLQRALLAANKDLGEVTVELTATNEYSEKLRKNCDFSGSSFEERKARRDAELKSLQNALAIISGEAMP